MEPINYLAQVADPFAAALKGYQGISTILNDEAKRAEAVRLQQMQQQQQQQLAQEQAKFFTNPNPTMRDAALYASLLSPDQAKAFEPFMQGISKEQQQGFLKSTGKLLSLLQFNPEIAAKEMKILADASRKSGDEADASLYEQMAVASIKPENKASVFLALASRAAGIPGAKEMFEIYDKASKTNEVSGGQTISTAADKVAAGITDTNGKPLPGTFFVQPGKKPELVTSEKVAKPGFTILTPQEAKERGLPIQGYTWQINKETNDINALVKPSQASVQVNIPGQPVPPTELEKQMDIKFAPLAVDWLAGEKTLAASRINQLNAVTKTLESGNRISGPVVGLTPDVVLSFVNPASRETRANAERVIQEGLRATLGAQFTRVEGENFLARAYDPKAPQADNVRRLRSIVTQMQESSKDREAMLKFVQGSGKGSLKGYTGRVPTINDFYAAIEVQTPASPEVPTPVSPAETNRSKSLDAAINKYKSK